MQYILCVYSEWLVILNNKTECLREYPMIFYPWRHAFFLSNISLHFHITVHFWNFFYGASGGVKEIQAKNVQILDINLYKVPTFVISSATSDTPHKYICKLIIYFFSKNWSKKNQKSSVQYFFIFIFANFSKTRLVVVV